MKLDVKLQLLHFSFGVLNSIFLVLGLSVGGCGVWILFDQETFLSALQSGELRTVGAGLLFTGGVVLASGVVGCVGFQRENRILLLTNVVLLVVLVLGQIFITLLLLITRQQVAASLEELLAAMVVAFGRGGGRDRLVERLQRYGRCCGLAGPSDWLSNSEVQGLNLSATVLPCSCFALSRRSGDSPWCWDGSARTPSLGHGKDSFAQGCSEELSDWLQENQLTIVGMDLSLVFIQVLLLVLSVSLYRAIGQKSVVRPGSAHQDPDQQEDGGEQNYTYTHAEDYGYADAAPSGYDPAYPPHHHGNREQLLSEPQQGRP